MIKNHFKIRIQFLWLMLKKITYLGPKMKTWPPPLYELLICIFQYLPFREVLTNLRHENGDLANILLLIKCHQITFPLHYFNENIHMFNKCVKYNSFHKFPPSFVYQINYCLIKALVWRVNCCKNINATQILNVNIRIYLCSFFLLNRGK